MVKRIFDLHFHQLKEYPQTDALADKINGKWKKISTKEMIDQAEAFASGLLELGLQPKDKVALISNNRSEWHIADLGILMAGMINVPIYPTITPEDYDYIMNNAEVKLCIVSDEELRGKVEGIQSNVNSLIDIYSFDSLSNCKNWSEIKIFR